MNSVDPGEDLIRPEDRVVLLGSDLSSVGIVEGTWRSSNRQRRLMAAVRWRPGELPTTFPVSMLGLIFRPQPPVESLDAGTG